MLGHSVNRFTHLINAEIATSKSLYSPPPRSFLFDIIHTRVKLKAVSAASAS